MPAHIPLEIGGAGLTPQDSRCLVALNPSAIGNWWPVRIGIVNSMSLCVAICWVPPHLLSLLSNFSRRPFDCAVSPAVTLSHQSRLVSLPYITGMRSRPCLDASARNYGCLETSMVWSNPSVELCKLVRVSPRLSRSLANAFPFHAFSSSFSKSLSG